MTLKELIEELEEIAEKYGDSADVVVKHWGEPPDPPVISVGANTAGDPVVVTIF